MGPWLYKFQEIPRPEGCKLTLAFVHQLLSMISLTTPSSSQTHPCQGNTASKVVLTERQVLCIKGSRKVTFLPNSAMDKKCKYHPSEVRIVDAQRLSMLAHDSLYTWVNRQWTNRRVQLPSEPPHKANRPSTALKIVRGQTLLMNH